MTVMQMMQGVQSSCPLPLLGCGAREIRLLHPIPLQIDEDLSIFDAFCGEILSQRGFRGWKGGGRTCIFWRSEDLNMPLWKDIEAKAAKLGVSVEQGLLHGC